MTLESPILQGRATIYIAVTIGPRAGATCRSIRHGNPSRSALLHRPPRSLLLRSPPCPPGVAVHAPPQEAEGGGAHRGRPRGRAAVGHHPAPAVQRGDRRGASAGCCRAHRLSARSPGDPGAGRFERRDPPDRCGQGRGDAGARYRRGLRAPPGPRGLQGGRARLRSEPRQGSPDRDLRRGLHPPARLPARGRGALPRERHRHGADPLGSHQPQRFAAHQRAGVDARWAPSGGKPGALRRGLHVQLLGHGRHLAGRRHSGRRRLAARHADRGSGSVVPRAARGLAVCLSSRRADAGGAPRGHVRLPRAAVPVGQGYGADGAQAASPRDAHEALGAPSASRPSSTSRRTSPTRS